MSKQERLVLMVAIIVGIVMLYSGNNGGPFLHLITGLILLGNCVLVIIHEK